MIEKQHVVLEGTSRSSVSEVDSGIPQGTVMGHFLLELAIDIIPYSKTLMYYKSEKVIGRCLFILRNVRPSTLLKREKY